MVRAAERSLDGEVIGGKIRERRESNIGQQDNIHRSERRVIRRDRQSERFPVTWFVGAK